MVQIDHDIPPLSAFRNSLRVEDWPFGSPTLAVGDSFLIPIDGITRARAGFTQQIQQTSPYVGLATRAKNLYKRKFRVATVDGGVRVWRVA